MIKGTLLLAAMSLPLTTFTFGPQYLPVKTPPLASLLGVTGRILYVENETAAVSGIGRVRIKQVSFPFVDETFQVIFWETEPKRHHFTFVSVWTNWLTEAIRMTVAGGFLVFNEDHYVRWGRILQAFGWDRLPFLVEGLSIYQKPMHKPSKSHRHIRSAA
jgi:hypothetical protein